MADVFLSYQRADVRFAKAVAKSLRTAGFSVFFDEMIPVGDMWDWKIEVELDAAKAVVPIWSENSACSKWVRIEATEGDRRGILAPILFEKCAVPVAFRLTESADLRDWKTGDQNALEWRNLLARLEVLAGPRKSFVRPKGKRAAKLSSVDAHQLALPLDVPPIGDAAETAWAVFSRSARTAFEQSQKEDFIQYRVAAAQDFAWAQYMLGLMHLFGKGVAEDPLEAVRWLKSAGSSGFYGADFALGLMFEFGVGIRRDTRRARPCYRRAAKRGHQLAKLALARVEANDARSG